MYIYNLLVKENKAFLKDTKHILQLLKGSESSGDMVMVTADVASLYTNIDHQGAIRAVKWALKKHTNIKRKFILKSFGIFVWNAIYFWYENIYYLQRGVTMGAKFAPSVADLYIRKMGGGCFI